MGIPLQFLGQPCLAPAGVAIDFKGSKETNWVSVCTKECLSRRRLCQKPKGVFTPGADYLTCLFFFLFIIPSVMTVNFCKQFCSFPFPIPLQMLDPA